VKSPNKSKNQRPLFIKPPPAPNTPRVRANLKSLDRKASGFTVTPIPNLSNSVNTTAFMNTYLTAIIITTPERLSGFKAVGMNQCRHEDDRSIEPDLESILHQKMSNGDCV